jgi:cytochrome P450
MPPAAVREILMLDVLRERQRAEGDTFWLAGDDLVVLDPALARRLNGANFADLTMPAGLRDLLRGRSGEPLSWASVRSAWTAQLHRLTEPAQVAALSARMSALIEARLDQDVDLGRLAHEVCTRSLLPVVVADLPPADLARVTRELIDRVRDLSGAARPRWHTAHTTALQIGSALAVRRALRARATGRRPRQLDLTDPLAVDLMPVLGMDRAVDATTALLSAIAGPPGATAACLLYELAKPPWPDRLAAELAPLEPAALHTAPLTARFVKEVLRMWSPLPLLQRDVRTPIDLPGLRLRPGQRYLLSPHVIHRDPRYWADPDTFDPDRWLSGASHGNRYVPFGWAPRACVGAGLATIQLILLCHLMTTRYRLHPTDPAATRIDFGTTPVPRAFRGRISRAQA